MTKSNETVKTRLTEVSCCGKEAPYDHPLVYLKIDKKDGNVTCPYCSKKFIFTK